MGSYIVDDIMQEYKRKKQYKQNKAWSEVQNYIKENCKNCKNKEKNLCHIVKTIDGRLRCSFKE